MPARVNPNDLLILLEVAHTGRYSRAAEVLGLNHTTIARRIATVEQALGGRVLTKSISGWELTPLGAQAVDAAERVHQALEDLDGGPTPNRELKDVVRISTPDAFAFHVAAPAAARVHRRHRGITVEIISATRRAATQRSGLDIEVVVGKPDVLNAQATRLGSYVLGTFGSRDYFEEHPQPHTVADLAQHGLVYFIPSMLQLDYLDIGRHLLPAMRDAVTSTSVLAHVDATVAGAGIGLIPTFLAARHTDLVRVLADEVSLQLEYWLVTRTEAMRRPAVAAVAQELVSTISSLTNSDGILV